MKFVDNLKDALVERAAELIAASLTVVFVWASYQIAPAVLPAIKDAVSTRVLLALLVTSLILNFIFLLIAWVSSRGDGLRLKYGVYWDKQKNPHCPSCKRPLSRYGEYHLSGTGYFCKACNEVIPLADARGYNVDPATAISDL